MHLPGMCLIWLMFPFWLFHTVAASRRINIRLALVHTVVHMFFVCFVRGEKVVLVVWHKSTPSSFFYVYLKDHLLRLWTKYCVESCLNTGHSIVYCLRWRSISKTWRIYNLRNFVFITKNIFLKKKEFWNWVGETQNLTPSTFIISDKEQVRY